jgi:hypothetical protein
MRRRWIAALALAAITFALFNPIYSEYVVMQARAAHIEVIPGKAFYPLGSLPEELAIYLSLAAAIAAATRAAQYRRWGWFAALLAVLLLFLGGLNPIGAVLAYFAMLEVAYVLPDRTASELVAGAVLAFPALVTALAALLWAAFPGSPRMPIAHREPRTSPLRGGGFVVILVCAGALLLLSSWLLLSHPFLR